MSFLPNSGAGNEQSILDQIGAKYGFRTTSIFRTPQENAVVNGVSNSQHMIGTARDYSIQGKSASQVDAFLDALNRIPGMEAFRHKAPGGVEHVHTEIASDKPEEGCPSWVPKSLCSGFKKVSAFGGAALYAGTGGAATAAVEEEAGSWSSWIVRAGLFGIALVLIAAAVVFIFKDTAAEVVGGTVAKALKGA